MALNAVIIAISELQLFLEFCHLAKQVEIKSIFINRAWVHCVQNPSMELTHPVYFTLQPSEVHFLREIQQGNSKGHELSAHFKLYGFKDLNKLISPGFDINAFGNARDRD
jgi:hypothetical protein